MSISTLQQASQLVKRAFSVAAYLIHQAKEDSGDSLRGMIKMLMDTVDDLGELEMSDSTWDQFHVAAMSRPENVATVADIHDVSYHAAALQFAMRVRSAIRCPGGKVANIFSGGDVGEPEECSIRLRTDGSSFTWTSWPVTYCEVDPQQLAEWWPEIFVALSTIAAPETERTTVCLKNEIRRAKESKPERTRRFEDPTIASPPDEPLPEPLRALLEAEISSLVEFVRWADDCVDLVREAEQEAVRLIVDRIQRQHAKWLEDPDLIGEAMQLNDRSQPALVVQFLRRVAPDDWLGPYSLKEVAKLAIVSTPNIQKLIEKDSPSLKRSDRDQYMIRPSAIKDKNARAKLGLDETLS